MVTDHWHGARAQPIRLGRELRAETKFELPKLRGAGGPYSAADCHTLGMPRQPNGKLLVGTGENRQTSNGRGW